MTGMPSAIHQVHQVALAMALARAEEEVVRTAVEAVLSAVGVDAAVLHLLDPSRQIFALKAAAGFSPAIFEKLQRYHAEDTPVCVTAMTTMRPLASPVETYAISAVRSALESEGIRFMACAPLLAKGEVLGVVQVARRANEPFSDDDLASLLTIGSIVGVAVERAVLSGELTRSRDQLRALAAGNVQAREEEARRIAHELHDEAGQLLTRVHLAVDEIVSELPPPQRAKRSEEVTNLLDQVYDQLRRVAQELRPTILDDLGLRPALEFLAQGISARTKLAVSIEGSIPQRPPPDIETALYRIVQEALTNVSKHGGATQVTIQLRLDGGGIRCSIRDDGRGFDVTTALSPHGERGLGLIGIQERVAALHGTLEIRSAAGQGTELQVTIPLESASASSSV